MKYSLLTVFLLISSLINAQAPYTSFIKKTKSAEQDAIGKAAQILQILFIVLRRIITIYLMMYERFLMTEIFMLQNFRDFQDREQLWVNRIQLVL